jgi:hypothetical protein
VGRASYGAEANAFYGVINTEDLELFVCHSYHTDFKDLNFLSVVPPITPEKDPQQNLVQCTLPLLFICPLPTLTQNLQKLATGRVKGMYS